MVEEREDAAATRGNGLLLCEATEEGEARSVLAAGATSLRVGVRRELATVDEALEEEAEVS